MKKFTLRQIKVGTKGRTVIGSEDATVQSICTDSRKAKEGDLFFALIGDKHDAHKYLPQVKDSGCNCAIISDASQCPEGMNAVVVDDTTKALQDLSAWYLQQLNLKVIGVTGSTGKTSTRDLTWAVCSEKYKTQKNVGNLNNHLGVPLTILSFDEDVEVGVLEMGMDKKGEIDFLADLARPDIGVITNIGMSHMENFENGRDGIFEAKMELTNYFDESNVLIVARDDEYLNKGRIDGAYRLVSAGSDGKSDYIISHIDDFGAEGIQFTLEYQGVMQRFRLPIPGRHNAFNSALAVAAGAELGISMEEAARGLEKVQLTDKRLTVRGKNGIKIIDDTYNASPDSVKAAIDVLMKTKGIRSVAILGDMFELGKTSRKEHELVGRYAAMQNVQMLIAIGEASEETARGAKEEGMENVHYFCNKDAFYKEMDGIIKKGDVILVKGSRGMEMEQIVKKIME